MFLVLTPLLVIVLPSPWNVVGGLVGVVLAVLEVAYWRRRVRGQKVNTGVENLLGATGEVTAALAPSGQIRVRGELWEARSTSELPRGSLVRVVAIDGLTLDVAAIDGPGQTRATGAVTQPREVSP